MKKKDRFISTTLFGILISTILAFGYVMWGMPINGLMMNYYVFFLSTSFLLIISFMYYLYFEDITESVAISIGGLWALYSGLEDIFVYGFLKKIPEKLPWLKGEPAGFLAGLLGNEVTFTMLVGNVVVTGIVAYFIIRILYQTDI